MHILFPRNFFSIVRRANWAMSGKRVTDSLNQTYIQSDKYNTIRSQSNKYTKSHNISTKKERNTYFVFLQILCKAVLLGVGSK